MSTETNIIYIDYYITLCADGTQTTVTFEVENDPEVLARFYEAENEYESLSNEDISWPSYYSKVITIFLQRGFERKYKQFVVKN